MMNVKIERDEIDGWNLFVDGALELRQESYAMVDQVRCSLQGCWPTHEAHEKAASIRRHHQISTVDAIMPIAELERIAILKAVAMFDGSTGKAARALGISQRAVQYKLRKYREEGRTEWRQPNNPESIKR